MNFTLESLAKHLRMCPKDLRKRIKAIGVTPTPTTGIHKLNTGKFVLRGGGGSPRFSEEDARRIIAEVLRGKGNRLGD